MKGIFNKNEKESNISLHKFTITLAELDSNPLAMQLLETAMEQNPNRASLEKAQKR
jgi:hypothetical protein